MLASQLESKSDNVGSLNRRWQLSMIAVSILIIGVFAIVLVTGYGQVEELTTPSIDTSWMISQLEYEYEGLLLATETNVGNADLRLQGDIYLSRIGELRNSAVLEQLRRIVPNSIINSLLASSEATDRLLSRSNTPEGHRLLLEHLRRDLKLVEKDVLALFQINHVIARSYLVVHAGHVWFYMIGIGVLSIIVGALCWFLAILKNRINLADVLNQFSTRATKNMSRFLAEMSHEIRTPLNGIIGTLHSLENEDLSSDGRDSFNILVHSSQTLLSTVNDILDLSKIENGKVTISEQWFDTRTLVSDVLSHNEVLIHGKDIDLLVQIDDSLPKDMHSDRLRVQQILNNFISNSLKFTSAGSVTIKVERSSDRSIENQGLGAFSSKSLTQDQVSAMRIRKGYSNHSFNLRHLQGV